MVGTRLSSLSLLNEHVTEHLNVTISSLFGCMQATPRMVVTCG